MSHYRDLWRYSNSSINVLFPYYKIYNLCIESAYVNCICGFIYDIISYQQFKTIFVSRECHHHVHKANKIIVDFGLPRVDLNNFASNSMELMIKVWPYCLSFQAILILCYF